MSSMLLATKVPSSAYHFLDNFRPHDFMSYPLLEALSHLTRSSIIRSNRSGESGSPCRVPLRIPMGGRASVRSDELGCSPRVEVCDDVDEVLRQAEERNCSDQLSVVG